MIKSFRGQLADQGQETIRLATNNGLTGYRIKKFELFGHNPGAVTQESVVKIFSVDVTNTTPTPNVTFDDPTLLAVSYLSLNTSNIYPAYDSVVFDNVTINQDIYVQHYDNSVGEAVNYYIELEQVKLSLDEAAVATLKDMRGTN
jgi:hypothetical protein